MVYYGSLSKGCQQCRKRKVKCDQGKPHCTRCGKSGVVCPGYRDLSEVTFRDENSRIIRRARKRDARDAADEPADTRLEWCSSRSSRVSTSTDSPPALSPSMFPPLEELALHFFLAKWGWDELPLSPDFNQWVKQNATDRTDPAMCSVMEAVGLASLSNIYFAPDVALKARTQYSRALQATAKRLKHPTAAAEDSTLFTVFMLSVWEFVNFDCHQPEKSLGWLSHIDGAISLLKLRDRKASPRRFQICSLIRSSVLYACMQSDITVWPEFFDVLVPLRDRALNEYMEGIRDSPVGDLCVRLLTIRARLRKNAEYSTEGALEAMSVLSADLDQWKVTMDAVWGYKTVDADHPRTDAGFKGKHHVYNNVWTAQFWNNWRALRLLVNRYIIDLSIQQGAAGDLGVDARIAIIRDMADEICIAAPCFLNSTRTAVLIWPLSIVAQEPLCTLEARMCAVKQLHLVTADSGIRQSAMLAESFSQGMLVAQSGSDPGSWASTAMVT